MASDNIWVGDLPAELTKPELDIIFGAYGDIVQSKLMPPKNPGQKASAMIRFKTVDEAQFMVENLDGNLMEGLPPEPIKVRYANSSPGQGTMHINSMIHNSVINNGMATPVVASPLGTTVRQSAWRGAAEAGWAQAGKAGTGAATPVVVVAPPAAAPVVNTAVLTGQVVAPPGKGKGKTGAPGSFQTLYAAADAIFRQSLGERINIPVEQQVYVQNLPADTNDQNLYQLFAPFGAISPTGVRVLTNVDGTCKGIGFVDFLSAESASNAVQVLDKLQTSDGGSITVCLKRDMEVKGKGKDKWG